MFDRKYKKLVKLIRMEMKRYYRYYEMYRGNGDDEKSRYWYARYHTLENILEKSNEDTES